MSSVPPSTSTLSDPNSPGLRRLIVPSVFVLLCFGLLFYRRPSPAPQHVYWDLKGAIFGTTYLVKLRAPAKGPSQQALHQRLHKALEAVDWAMSTYKKQSELSRFNASASTDAIKVSDALFRVVAAAQKVSRLSQGAFDITVGPVVNIWGFGPHKTIKPPESAVISAARARVGYQKLVLDAKARTLRKSIPSLYLDLSAIAKGYAVDVLAENLDSIGVLHYMAEIGGEVRTRGVNAQGKIWRIGVERPTDGLDQQVQSVVPLRDAAMATSGNYRNYIMVDGRRVSHLIDARTASPVSHDLASVSVIYADCMMADALATALYVLGPEEGLKLAKAHQWAVLYLVPKGKGFARLASPAFETLLQQTQQP